VERGLPPAFSSQNKPVPSAIQQRTWHSDLLAWYEANARDLPWRRTRDPYAIWVSEVMLQQTQVATVIPYWHRWMDRFPTIEALAEADEQEVLATWQGLGYYRRCRMLLQGAKVVDTHGMPQTSKDWLTIPGVGRYTAAAIASIAYGEPAPLVDGNVERVFARLTACNEQGAGLTKAAWKWAEKQICSPTPQHLQTPTPSAWNQALMELGATICRPTTPLCSECPIKASCRAYQQGWQAELPKPKLRPQSIDLTFRVLVQLSKQGRYGVRQIPSSEWWQGMWEFPKAEPPLRGGGGCSSAASLDISLQPIATIKHQVTHHRIRFEVFLATDQEESPDLVWKTAEQLIHLPMPAPQRKILKLVSAPRLF